MKQVLLLILITSAFIANARSSQDSIQAASSADKQEFLLNRLTEDLDLTDLQRSQVKEIIANRSTALTAKKYKEHPTKDSQEVSKVNDHAVLKLKEVLTKEQFILYNQLKNELAENRKLHASKSANKAHVKDVELEF